MSTTVVTPQGDAYQPDPIHRFVRKATTLCKIAVAPIQDHIDERLNVVHMALVAARESPGTYLFPETGEAYSDREAKAQWDHDMEIVRAEREAGLTHHERTEPWLVASGKASPFAEALGLLTMLQLWFNVDLLRPYLNWLAWTATVVIVIVVSLAQKLTAERAGKAHNSAREQGAERHEIIAAGHRRTRNFWLVIAGLIALLVSTALAVRGLQSMGVPTWWQASLIVVASAVTGLGTAALAYCAVALDGSVYSRRADCLGAQGEAAWTRQNNEIESGKENIAAASNAINNLITAVLPSIVADVRQSFGSSREETMESLQPVAECANRLENQSTRLHALEADLNGVERLSFGAV
ncbi:MAG: hypothetical protein LBN10_11725 [Propionibacteriaceae bacterium]|jgi:uncharacterized membrane protein YhaH (DUF805 family)|nr:hypothetical protein [Propionibacteriaceae bacterium]